VTPPSAKSGVRALFRVWRGASLILSILLALIWLGPVLGAATRFLDSKVGVTAELLEPTFEGGQITVSLRIHNWWVFDLDRVVLQIDLVDSQGVIASGKGETSIPSLSQGIVIVRIDLSPEQASRLSAPFGVDARAHFNYALSLIALDILVKGRLI
jgi:hypothetical protein